MADEFSTHLSGCKVLTPEDRDGIMWVLRQCPHVEAGAKLPPIDQPPWQPFTKLNHISISRQMPVAPERVYKLRGVGHIPVDFKIIYEMIVRIDLMRLWDPLQKTGHLIHWTDHQADGVEQGLAHTVYGVNVPGASMLFNDRDLLTRIVTVRFPGNGVTVLYAHSVSDGTVGDPGPAKRTVRAHVGPSGWVLVPQPDGTTALTVIMQVDPKGSVPPFVVNAIAIAIPLHIYRMGKVIKGMAPERLRDIVAQRRRDIRFSSAEPPRPLSVGSATSSFGRRDEDGSSSFAPQQQQQQRADLAAGLVTHSMGNLKVAEEAGEGGAADKAARGTDEAAGGTDFAYSFAGNAM